MATKNLKEMTAALIRKSLSAAIIPTFFLNTLVTLSAPATATTSTPLDSASTTDNRPSTNPASVSQGEGEYVPTGAINESASTITPSQPLDKLKDPSKEGKFNEINAAYINQQIENGAIGFTEAKNILTNTALKVTEILAERQNSGLGSTKLDLTNPADKAIKYLDINNDNYITGMDAVILTSTKNELRPSATALSVEGLKVIYTSSTSVELNYKVINQKPGYTTVVTIGTESLRGIIGAWREAQDHKDGNYTINISHLMDDFGYLSIPMKPGQNHVYNIYSVPNNWRDTFGVPPCQSVCGLIPVTFGNFLTQTPVTPSISAPVLTQALPTSVKISATVSNFPYDPIRERVVVVEYFDPANPSNIKTADMVLTDASKGLFEAEITGLTPGVKYTFRVKTLAKGKVTSTSTNSVLQTALTPVVSGSTVADQFLNTDTSAVENRITFQVSNLQTLVNPGTVTVRLAYKTADGSTAYGELISSTPGGFFSFKASTYNDRSSDYYVEVYADGKLISAPALTPHGTIQPYYQAFFDSAALRGNTLEVRINPAHLAKLPALAAGASREIRYRAFVLELGTYKDFVLKQSASDPALFTGLYQKTGISGGIRLSFDYDTKDNRNFTVEWVIQNFNNGLGWQFPRPEKAPSVQYKDVLVTTRNRQTTWNVTISLNIPQHLLGKVTVRVMTKSSPKTYASIPLSPATLNLFKGSFASASGIRSYPFEILIDGVAAFQSTISL